MKLRRLSFILLAALACSRSSEDAGIVLNIDTDVTADRALIDRITVTVDSKHQDWTLVRPLPGSLGIETSPGSKQVTVEGYAGAVLRGRWSSVIVASKGKVIVQDVHLAPVGGTALDAGPADGARADAAIADGARDSVDAGAGPIDGSRGEATGGASGNGGTTGRITLPPLWDSGSGEASGTGGIVAGTGGRSAGTGGIVAGTGGSVGTGGSPGRDGGDAALPLDTRDGPSAGDDGAPPVSSPLTGAFAVSSDFSIPATAAAPGPVGNTLDLVHGFVVDPGTAILNFAEDAGVPGLATLRAALPDVLESQLTGWMNSYIQTASVNGVTPYSQLVWLDTTIRALLLYWGLDSRLALPIGSSGTHAPVTLVLASTLGTPYAVPLDPMASVTQGVGVTATVSWPGGSAGPAVVTISDHFMGLPFGRYALQALDAILLAEYGAPDVATYLANAVGCAGMAAYVASQCVNVVVSTVCVGHESDMFDVCAGGLAEGARQIENQILGIDFKAIHFQQGIATAVGATVSRPQDATALQNGVWTATVDFGSGAEPATATFSATSAP